MLRELLEGQGGGAYPALMYHAVDEADGQPESEDYTISSEVFERHLKLLTASRREGFPLARMMAGEVAPPSARVAMLTFDDGFESVLTRAAPLLVRHAFGAVLFITTEKIGQPGYLSEAQVQRLLGEGIIVGAHGATHRFLADLPLAELRRELDDSKARLEDLVGYRVVWMSAPGGRVDARVVLEARRAGFRCVFGSRPGLIPAQDPPDILPRVAITKRITDEALGALLRMAPSAWAREVARYEALAMPKRLLGNQGYEALRRTILAKTRGG
jgi:peptidoglycan/xylan/chitin deacetylase (PgdA/CDA1 family)